MITFTKTTICIITAVYTFIFFPLILNESVYAQEKKINSIGINSQSLSFSEKTPANPFSNIQSLSLKSGRSKPWYRNWRIWIIAEVIIIGTIIAIVNDRNKDVESPQKEIFITSPAP